MTRERLATLTAGYAHLRVAVVGDFCLDRYLEIDPARAEFSLETGLAVQNVTRVRAQPGAAGTVLNNLVALGVGEIVPALRALAGVNVAHFFPTPLRRTFTYCKPLVLTPGEPPRELSRLDSKNWTPTPEAVSAALARALTTACDGADAVIVMDQVDLAETGVVTAPVLARLGELARRARGRPVLADCRRGLRDYPPCIFKMNAAELRALTGLPVGAPDLEIHDAVRAFARRNERPVFVTLAERGLLAATPDGAVEHVAARPVRGPIDVVGAGDSVTANLAAALAAGATAREALELAALASSVVLHQLGTSGAATVAQMKSLFESVAPASCS